MKTVMEGKKDGFTEGREVIKSNEIKKSNNKINKSEKQNSNNNNNKKQKLDYNCPSQHIPNPSEGSLEPENELEN